MGTCTWLGRVTESAAQRRAGTGKAQRQLAQYWQWQIPSSRLDGYCRNQPTSSLDPAPLDLPPAEQRSPSKHARGGWSDNSGAPDCPAPRPCHTRPPLRHTAGATHAVIRPHSRSLGKNLRRFNLRPRRLHHRTKTSLSAAPAVGSRFPHAIRWPVASVRGRARWKLGLVGLPSESHVTNRVGTRTIHSTPSVGENERGKMAW